MAGSLGLGNPASAPDCLSKHIPLPVCLSGCSLLFPFLVTIPSPSLSSFYFLLLQQCPSQPILSFPFINFPFPYYLWAKCRSEICVPLFIRGNFMFCIFTLKVKCPLSQFFFSLLKEDPIHKIAQYLFGLN